LSTKIDHLASQYLNAMKSHGYSELSYKHAKYILAQIINWHKRYSKTDFDADTLKMYIDSSEERLAKDQAGRNYSQLQVHTAKRFLVFGETGKFETKIFQVKKTALNPYYDEIVDKYLDDTTQNPKARNRASWSVKRLFAWLISHDINDIGEVTYIEVRQYILDMVSVFSPKTIPNLRSGLRKFFKWTFDTGYTINTFEALFDFTVAIERKIQPAPLPDEVSLVLDSIDRNTTIGKRNYAVIMLGIVTGIRAGDVASLQLSDIDWQKGEIRIIQNKTGKPLALPLTKDVGESLSDYILNARPESGSKNVFLRAIPPHREFSGGSAVGGIYQACRKQLGLSAGGFHSLRRALGKSLVMSGSPVTTVAQVLGHSTIDNTQQYIALDVLHLKECALDFTGIEPKRCAE
jgi:integrase